MSTPEEILIGTKLIGDKQVIAGLVAESEAIQRLGRSTAIAGAEMQTTARRGLLMNQALFTVRRFLYSGTLALTAMTGAVTILGLKFNANMEMNVVAMGHFLGSTVAAKTELNFLYELAAKTPFEFMQLTAAARQFLAFGFTLKETNRLLSSVGDTAAGLGVGAEGINRIVLAFGQMRTAGRVLGGELRQLQEVGIPASRYLKEAFNLSPKQMRSIGALGIPADIGLDVIIKGMQKDFGGAAKEQAKTFSGQISTLHDYASRLAGQLTFPLFESLRKRLIPKLNQLTQMMSDSLARGEGFAGAIRAMDETLTPRSHRIIQLFTQIRGLVIDLGRTLGGLWRAAKDPALATLILGLGVLRTVLFVLAHTTKVWAPILKYVLIYLIAQKIYVTALTVGYYAWGRAILFLMFIEKAQVRLTKIIVFWQGILTVFTKGYIKSANGQFLAMTRLQKVALTLRLAFFQLAAALEFLFLATPIGWIILAVAGFALLYWKVKGFRDWVNANWPYLVGMILAPFITIPIYIARHFEEIKHTLMRFFNWVAGKIGWLVEKISWLKSKIPGSGGFHFPFSIPSFGLPFGLAQGGVTPWPGQFLVGERGPELATLPGGTRITPNDKLEPIFRNIEGWMKSGGRGDGGPRVIQLVVDGRVLAEVVDQQQRVIEATA